MNDFGDLASKRDPTTLSLAERIALDPEGVAEMERLDAADARALLYDWRFWRRPAQARPLTPHKTWYVRAGRGFGKTRTGAETMRDEVVHHKRRRVALIGATAADVRDTMIEGESGLLVCHPPDTRPTYIRTRRMVEWPSGARGFVYSAEEPDRLRGPQHEFAWGDEPAAWKYGKESYDNLMFGLRLGSDPWAMFTGTPKPRPWLRMMAAHPTTVMTRGSLYENAANLPPSFVADILGRYEGTRLGAQEIHGDFLDAVEGAIWDETTIDAHRTYSVPLVERTVVAVDPSGSELTEAGIIVAGGPRAPTPIAAAWVLEDVSLAARPEAWAAQAIAAYYRHGADRIVVEDNYGGDMTRATIHAIDKQVRVHKVRAGSGKRARAEPVSALYERGRVHHVGYFPLLESEMVTWVEGDQSPNRLDALVWAITDLLLGAPPPSAVQSVASRSIAGPGSRW